MKPSAPDSDAVPASEDRFLRWLVIAVSLAFAWILVPFYGAVLWAIVLAIMFAPLQRNLLGRLRQRRTLAALGTVLVILLLVILPLTLLGGLLVQEVVGLYQQVQSGELDLGQFLHRVQAALPAWVGNALDRIGLGSLDAVQQRLSSSMAQILEFVATRAVSIGQNTLQFVVSLFITLYLLFFFVRDGDDVLARLKAAIALRPERQEMLVSRFASVVRATVKGSLVVAVVQGVLGSLILMLLGVRAPILWGALIAALSLLPAVGPPVVWLPIVLYFLLTGAIWQGVVLALFGGLVIGSVDNILRPILVGKETSMPDYVVLISTLGGIAAVGLNGIVVGPIIAAMFMAVWGIHSASMAARWQQHPPRADPPVAEPGGLPAAGAPPEVAVPPTEGAP